jgi:hypothetical protein
MDEISVQMAMSTEATYSRAVSELMEAGYRPGRGPRRAAFPIVLVVRRLSDETEKQRIERVIRSVDPEATPVMPPGTFAR